jgi:ABC-type transporter Mla maintaining outer membrane lipid asymmetry ATPase subunit MlaF
MDGREILKIESVCLRRECLLEGSSFSLTLDEGENVVIFGPEDSGINSLCPIIARLEDEFEGEIFFKGRSIESFDYFEAHKYRTALGYLQRDYGLINNMSVEENIKLPLRYHSKLTGHEIGEKVNSLIQELNLTHCRTERPVALSAAETLRTAYARAIALDPTLMLVEHSLAGQCLLNTQAFMNHLKFWAAEKHRATIFVTFDPERFVDFSNRFIMLYRGAAVFSGTRDEFLEADNEYLLQYRISSHEGPMKII